MYMHTKPPTEQDYLSHAKAFGNDYDYAGICLCIHT